MIDFALQVAGVVIETEKGEELGMWSNVINLGNWFLDN
jgi:hypothetical protein